jgi:hypothetical protein
MTTAIRPTFTVFDNARAELRVRNLLTAFAADREISLKARALSCTSRMAIAALLPVHPSFERPVHG